MFVRKRGHELNLLLHNREIDIIGLSETRLDERISDSEASIPGYHIIRNDRNINGAGVAIYIKDTVPSPVMKYKCDDLELLCLEIMQNIPNHFS